MAHFTHYWQTSTVDEHRRLCRAGAIPAVLDHVASNLFRDRGVHPDDTIHVINFADGVLWIIGRMVVGELIDEAAASRRANDLWEADDHCFAKPGKAGRLRFDAEFPVDRIDDIEFLDRNGVGRPPARNRHGEVDPQTFRGVRRISADTARLFDTVLGT